jgi:hypothetical protein
MVVRARVGDPPRSDALRARVLGLDAEFEQSD